MTEHFTRQEDRRSSRATPAPRGARLRSARTLRSLALYLAMLLTVGLLADPFDLHGMDQRFHQFLGLAAPSYAESEAPELWTCPMHPEVLQKEPGSCPICKMDLVPVKKTTTEDSPREEHDAHPPASSITGASSNGEGASGRRPGVQEDGSSSGSGAGAQDDGASRSTGAGAQEDGAARSTGAGAQEDAASGATDEGAQLWTCGMHPQVLQDEPGSCPICKMDLTPVRKGSAPESAEEGERPAVSVTSSVVQKMNVRTEVAMRGDLRAEIRTVGYLEYDPDRVVSVTTKFPGYIEKTYADYIGQSVRRGDPLFEIYAPELVQTARELISAQQYAERLKDAPEDVRRSANALVDAARARLAFWDISAEDLGAASDAAAIRTFAIRAPRGGVITRRAEGLEGMAVEPGSELLQIADVSRLWLSVEVFENQLPWIEPGSDVVVSLPYFPGYDFHGTVRFLEPSVSPETRSVRMGLDVPNSDGRLRAGMYATVTFDPVLVSGAVLVSEQAVIRTGERDVVVVSAGEGRFEPRTVTLGPASHGHVQILDGVREGEEIVTSAQFLIDSESNLQAAIQRLMAEHAH